MDLQMEGEYLTDQQGIPFMFDFEFEDEVIDNPFSQAHPDNQSNPAVWNTSHENAEQGSSTGSNPPASIFEQHLSNINNIGHSYPSLEIASFISPPSPLSVSSDSITGTPQANNPAAEISSVFQPPTQENRQPQLVRANTNPSVPRQAHISQDSAKQPLIYSLNNFSPFVTTSLNTSFLAAPQPFFPTLNEVETFLESHDELLSHQFNTLSGNSLQNESLPYNNNQPAISYQTSFPINSTRLGIGNGRSHINQLPRSCLCSYHNPPYAPLNPLRPQCSPSQLDQFPLASNLQNSQVLSFPMLRPQPYQLNQVLLPSNVQNSQGPSMFALRAPTYHQQLNHAVVKPNDLIMHVSDPKPMPRSDQELNHPNQQLISSQVMPNLIDSQIGLPSQPSMFQRSQILEQQGLSNQITRQCVAYPSPRGSQLSQVLNATEQEISGHNPSVMTLSELKMSLKKHKKQTFHKPRRWSRFEVKESTSVPKRPKRDLVGQENGPQDSISQAKDSGRHNHFNVSRSLKVYDRLFESVGLPIDPHLRHLAKLK